MSVIDTPPEESVPLEEHIRRHCHVGPPGREITATCVQGHAHLLQTRTLHEEMPPYVQAGMYMPPESACLLGEGVQEALNQSHRSNTQQTVHEPVETQELRRRGAVAFVPVVADVPCVYPDGYIAGYTQGKKRGRE